MDNKEKTLQEKEFKQVFWLFNIFNILCNSTVVVTAIKALIKESPVDAYYITVFATCGAFMFTVLNILFLKLQKQTKRTVYLDV